MEDLSIFADADDQANASSKRIASSNETTLHNLQLGLIGTNLFSFLLRLILSLLTSRSFLPSKKVIFLQLVSLSATLAIWRWFVLIGTPRRDAGGVKAGEDLGAKGVIEMAWDTIYISWICTLGSAVLGDWVWWFYLLIPGFAGYKLFNTFKPILGMLLPGLFGPKAPREAGVPVDNARAEPGESRKQAKLRARAEKGDKRIQQVQRK